MEQELQTEQIYRPPDLFVPGQANDPWVELQTAVVLVVSVAKFQEEAHQEQEVSIPLEEEP